MKWGDWLTKKPEPPPQVEWHTLELKLDLINERLQAIERLLKAIGVPGTVDKDTIG